MEWSIPEAGSIWADCLLRHLGVHLADRDSDREEREAPNTAITLDHHAHGDMLPQQTGGVVLVAIGGGHYVPKVNDVVTHTPFLTIFFFDIIIAVVLALVFPFSTLNFDVCNRHDV